jgi:hypothetical protein
MYNKYTQYPTVSGIIIARDRYYNHLFTMFTDNIQARIKDVDKQHLKGQIKSYPTSWGQHRVDVANNAGVIMWEYVSMPNTDKPTLKMIAEAMTAESLSKTQQVA